MTCLKFHGIGGVPVYNVRPVLLKVCHRRDGSGGVGTRLQGYPNRPVAEFFRLLLFKPYEYHRHTYEYERGEKYGSMGIFPGSERRTENVGGST